MIQVFDIQNELYEFKIGMRGIIYLQRLENITALDIFAAGIITTQPQFPMARIRWMWNEYQQENEDASLFEGDFSSLYSIDVRDLYEKIVGEVGIDPATFLSMDYEECELAYNGYLARQEMSANLMIQALNKALDQDYSPIQLLEQDEYSVGNEQERDIVFDRLGI